MAFIAEVSRYFLAFILALAVVQKTINFDDFKHNLTNWFNCTQNTAKAIAVFILLAESTILIGLISQWMLPIWLTGCLMLFSLFTLQILIVLLQGRRVNCSCFGPQNDRPLMWHDLMRNLIIIVFSVLSLTSLNAAVNTSYPLLAISCAAAILPITLHIYELANLIQAKKSYD